MRLSLNGTSVVFAIYLEAQLLHGHFLGLGTSVGDHPSANAVLDSLGDIMSAHEIVNEEIKTRELVNQSKIIEGDGFSAWLAIRNVSPHTWSVLFHIDDQVLELLLVDLEVLHDHVVAKTIALVEILNVVEQMLAVLLSAAVNCHAVNVERNHEENAQASTSVDMATNVLIVKGDIPPGTRSLGPTDSHIIC